MISDESKIKKDSCLKHKKIVFLTSLIPDFEYPQTTG